MIEESVRFKGTRGGLNIYAAREANLPVIMDSFLKKLQSSKLFFDGTKVNLIFTGREFEPEEQKQILKLFSRYMKPGTVEFRGNPEPEKAEDLSPEDQSGSFVCLEEGMTRFIRGTVRSGQCISYKGNIVVIGDVNPGGELIAGGNILVLGILRGIAQAGADGNAKAVVAAYCLLPTHLRIAGTIARAPEGETTKPSCPEIAYVKENHLFVEPYLPGKGRQDPMLQTNRI